MSGEWKFKQEYPANLDECFQSSGEPLIDSEILIPLMDDLTLDYTKYKLYNNLNFDFRIS